MKSNRGNASPSKQQLHYKLTFLQPHISNDEQFYDDVSSDVKYAPRFLEIILMLYTSSLLSTSWIKTRPAQKLLVQVKFTGNPYSYVCERPPLKYTQTRVCRNSYTGTRTVPDSYVCLCERSLTVTIYNPWTMCRRLTQSTIHAQHYILYFYRALH